MIGALIIGAIGVVIVFAIAAGVIGREAHRLDSFSPMPVFDVEEAVAYIGEHLPPEKSGAITYWEVRKVLDWELEDLNSRNLARESLMVEGPQGPHVADTELLDDGLLDRLLLRAMLDDSKLTADDIAAVLETKLGYLERIGAIGPRADPGELR